MELHAALVLAPWSISGLTSQLTYKGKANIKYDTVQRA